MGGILKIDDHSITVDNLEISIFQEGNTYIAHCPAFELSTCGNTVDKAQRRIHEAITIFIEEIITMGTFEDVLIECGWHKEELPLPKWVPPVFMTRKENINIPLPLH